MFNSSITSISVTIKSMTHFKDYLVYLWILLLFLLVFAVLGMLVKGGGVALRGKPTWLDV